MPIEGEPAGGERPGPIRPGPAAAGLRRSLQVLGALGPVAAALLDPFQAAIGVGRLVGIVLVDAGVQASLAGASPWRISGRPHLEISHCRSARAQRPAAQLPSWRSWWPVQALAQPRELQQASHRHRIGPCGSRSTSCRSTCRPSWRPDTWRCTPVTSAHSPVRSPRTQRDRKPQSRTQILFLGSSFSPLTTFRTGTQSSRGFGRDPFSQLKI